MNFFDRLSDYDLFVYVPQGIFVLAATDYVFGSNLVLSGTWNVPTGVLLFFVAYVGGHLVASPSSAILERVLARRVLKAPATNLFRTRKVGWFGRILFSDYYTPLAKPVREKVLRNFGTSIADGDDLYWSAYAVAKNDENAKRRMAIFLNLYGFCRNASFISITTALLLLMQIAWTHWYRHMGFEVSRLYVAIGLTIVGFMLFQRYLKFFRLYAVEVFVAYSNSTPTPPDPRGTPSEKPDPNQPSQERG